MSVYRVYVEKKAPFAVEAQGVLSDIRSSLGIHSASCVRILNRYDVEDISKEDFELAKGTIFSEPQVDDVYDELPSFAAEDRVFAVQFLPGQFDQRADSAVQCIQLATQHERPTVASAKVYVISGISDEELARIKAHLINPVESMEASMELPKTLHTPFDVPADVAVLEGFCELDQQGLQEFIDQYGLAMDLGDITFCQKYFKETEKRTPTITEIRMIDTYWSDHCRHTTFSTNIEQVDIESDYVKDAYNEYLELRKTLHAGKNKPMTLMDLATIGANTVVMPYGGKTQLTPSQAMVAKIPMLHGETNTCSIMSWGFNPYISDQDQFKGAQLAVVESIAKIIASGGSRSRCWLSFQEYFEKIGTDPEKWGKPFQSLLGGLKAQLELGCAAIGGKDSMSGSFEDIHVPPTLISFAVSTAKVNNVVTDEFKAAGDQVYLLAPEYDENGMPIYENIRKVFDHMESLIASGKVKAVYTLGMKGLGEALCKMSFGNRIGFAAQENLHHLFKPVYGAFVFEASEELDTFAKLIGCTTEEYTLQINGETVDLQEIQQKWEATLEPVYPRITKAPQETVPTYNYQCVERKTSSIKLAQPRVLIPVFPGTNCEYDTARAFERAGAKADIVVIRNKTSEQIKESVELIREKIANSQIIAIPGGFSGGDEPEGSAKFIASFFRNPQITEAVMELLKNRDGLMCGICNGFQALVKLGLVPYGEIISTDASCPTLTYNVIDRHQSGLVRTRIASNKSPWLMHTNVGDIHTIAISHGEGRFVASEQLVKQLAENGQIATQYVDLEGNPTEDYRFNPNGSIDAIEGITSPDGRVFGKMGHSERYTNGLYLNVDGDKDQKMFAGAVSYFRD